MPTSDRVFRNICQTAVLFVSIASIGCATVYETTAKYPKAAALAIFSQPPGATVYVNGRPVGTSPMTLNYQYDVKEQTVTPGDRRQAWAYMFGSLLILAIPSIYFLVKYPVYERVVTSPDALRVGLRWGTHYAEAVVRPTDPERTAAQIELIRTIEYDQTSANWRVSPEHGSYVIGAVSGAVPPQ